MEAKSKSLFYFNNILLIFEETSNTTTSDQPMAPRGMDTWAKKHKHKNKNTISKATSPPHPKHTNHKTCFMLNSTEHKISIAK